jgi:polysaccharide pyruvyl transferase WcaK-like protein
MPCECGGAGFRRTPRGGYGIVAVFKKGGLLMADKKNNQSLNPFDVMYGSVAYGIVQTLGTVAGVMGGGAKWKPGEKLKILFVAYSGARNTGAEVRVGECIRQVNKILGEDRVEINMLTLDKKETDEYYKGYKFNSVEFSSVFFGDVFKSVRKNHLVALVEGSCWKENFSSALLLYFIYAAGLAHKMGKPSFSYAVDAGNMNDFNNELSRRLSGKMTRIITRSADSTKKLQEIGLPVHSTRVDTAWTQEAENPEYARKVLTDKGWDGKKPLVGLAMQNYFWWPIVPDVAKFIKQKLTGDKELAEYNYKLIYYYDYDDEDEKTYDRWAQMLTGTMDWLTEKYNVQPVLIGMEALDKKSCLDVQSRMKNKSIVLLCQDYVGTQMAALLRQLNLLITTRYHAMVLSMPGRIPFIGLSRDERILGVMHELGLHNDYYLDYKMENLESNLRDRVDRIMGSAAEQERLKKVIDDILPYYYSQMGLLGHDIRELVRQSFPKFEMLDIDENDAMNMIPYCPPEIVERTRAKYIELKKAEGI